MTGFCAGGSTLTFSNTTNSPAAGPAEAASYGCLATRPNPAWFYMQVGDSGNLSFTMSQTSNATGNGIDVDFIAWGPFPGPPPIFGPLNLNPGTQVGCSYSTAATESFSIPNAQAGMYYVVLITNFSNQPGQISLTQTNAGQNGAGTTNCDIVCPLTLGSDAVLCPGDSLTLTSTIASEPNKPATFQWKNGPNVIPGATSQTYTVTTPGTYTVIVNKPGCVANASASVTITAPPPLPLSNPQDLVICANGPAPYIYNLRSVEPAMLGSENPGDYEFNYFDNEANAIGGFFPLANASAYPSAGNQTIYLRVDKVGVCAQIYNFQLLTTQAPVLTQPQPIELCDVNNDNTEPFDLTVRNAQILGAQDPALYTITYHTGLVAANANTGSIGTPTAYDSGATTVYVRVTVTGSPNCFAVTALELILNPTPEIIVPADGFACQADGYVLPVLAVGNYFTQPGGAGTQLNAGDVITTSQTIHIYAQTGTTPNCTDQE
ncbi:MAG: hypothetical protein ACO1N9_10385, partial [Flavobacterium sp.]